MENWKVIEGYEGYLISDLGNVKSLERIVHSGRSYGKRIKKEAILKKGINVRGYEIVVLSKSEGKKSFSVHRLVLQAFVPNHENKKEVNHIDGNKTNNRVDNLEWCTSSENSFHACRTGLQKSVAKKINQFDKDGNFIKSHNSVVKAAEEVGISFKTISGNLRGNLKSAGGYVWKYADDKTLE
jgi:hypothetical protein